MISLFKPSCIENKIDKWCFNLILFDIFFIPLFPWFSVSMSIPVIVLWYLMRGNKTKFAKEHRMWGAIAILMVLSTLLSLVGFEGSDYETTFGTSVKRLFQYIFSFWYFFFFVYFFSNYRRNINNIVFAGILYITLFAVLYYVNQELFIFIKKTICPFDPQSLRWLRDELPVYRFNFLWADPNNVAYASTTLALFYISEQKGNLINKYIVLLCLSFILLCTMSLGGIAIAFLLIAYVFIFSNKFREGKSGFWLGLAVFCIVVFIVLLNIDFFSEIFDSGVGKRHTIYGNEGVSGGGGRINDLFLGFSKFNPIFLFVGSGQEGFVHEIGHLYLIFMYGMPVYIFFMYIIFRKKPGQTFLEYLSIIPIFAGFTVNIAIGEQKYLLIAMLISAYYTAKQYRKRFKT